MLQHRKRSRPFTGIATYNPRGGLFGPDHQIINPKSKKAQRSTSKHGDF